MKSTNSMIIESKAIKMNKLLLVAFLIPGAISMSEQEGYSSSSKPPAMKPPYKCNKVGNKKAWCACRSQTTSAVIDLSSLGTEGIEASIRPPKYTSVNEFKGWSIAWSPCEDFDMFTNMILNPDEKACKGVGFARYYDKTCKGYGSHNGFAEFYSNGYDQETGQENFYIEFNIFIKAEQERRTAKIFLVCTPDSDKNYLEYQEEVKGIEIAKFHSKCCCSNQVCGKNTKKYTLGGGAIAGIAVSAVVLAIVLAVVLVVKCRGQPIRHPVQPQDAQEHDERIHILG